jgi:hypothetical protein
VKARFVSSEKTSPPSRLERVKKGRTPKRSPKTLTSVPFASQLRNASVSQQKRRADQVTRETVLFFLFLRALFCLLRGFFLCCHSLHPSLDQFGRAYFISYPTTTLTPSG